MTAGILGVDLSAPSPKMSGRAPVRGARVGHVRPHGSLRKGRGRPAIVTDLATDSAREGAPGARGFGLATATFVVVSSMIGTGVLTTSGFTAYYVGSNQW